MIIICPVAGIGSRLRPITSQIHKNMVKIAGKHIIDYIMEKIQETFPLGTTLCFIVGYKKDSFTLYMKERYSDLFDLVFLEQKIERINDQVPKYSGLGDAILVSRDIAENEDCAIILCDRLPVEGYYSLMKNFQSTGRDGIFNITKTITPQLYGIVQTDSSGTIVKIEEKPAKSVSNLAVSGGYVIGNKISPKMFTLLHEQKSEPLIAGKEHHMGVIFQKLIQNGANFGININKSPVLDFGNIKGLLSGNSWILEDYYSIPANEPKLIDINNFIDVKLIPPVYIGNRTEIFKSLIGPNVSIGDNCNISNCEIVNSVIGDSVNLQGMKIGDSLIGNNASNDNIEANSLKLQN